MTITPLFVVVLAGVILWFLLEKLSERALHMGLDAAPDDVATSYKQLLVELSCRVAQAVLGVVFFSFGLIASLRPPSAGPPAALFALIIGAGISVGRTVDLIHNTFAPAPRPLIFLWRATPFALVSIALETIAFPSSAAFPVSIPFLLVVLLTPTLDLAYYLTNRRLPFLPYDQFLAGETPKQSPVNNADQTKEDKA